MEKPVEQEISEYTANICIFEGFLDLPLSSGGLQLICIARHDAVPETKHVPEYKFEIRKDGCRAGEIKLRVGYTEGLYYGGNIGYSINESMRGQGYAEKACRLLIPLMKAHGMKSVIITNGNDNAASRRTCEKLGARQLRIAELPEWTDCYKAGLRLENVFEWRIEDMA